MEPEYDDLPALVPALVPGAAPYTEEINHWWIYSPKLPDEPALPGWYDDYVSYLHANPTENNWELHGAYGGHLELVQLMIEYSVGLDYTDDDLPDLVPAPVTRIYEDLPDLVPGRSSSMHYPDMYEEWISDESSDDWDDDLPDLLPIQAAELILPTDQFVCNRKYIKTPSAA